MRFGKAICHSDQEGLQVDLHRSLVVGPFGMWMRPDELFDRAYALGNEEPAFFPGFATPEVADDLQHITHDTGGECDT